MKNMNFFSPDGDPLSSMIVDFSPVNFSPNSLGFASVAVDMMNWGSLP